MGKDCCCETREDKQLRLDLEIERSIRRRILRGDDREIRINATVAQSITSGVTATTYTFTSPIILDAFIVGRNAGLFPENALHLPSLNLIGTSVTKNAQVYELGLFNMFSTVRNINGMNIPSINILSTIEGNAALTRLGILQQLAESDTGAITYLVNITSVTFYTI